MKTGDTRTALARSGDHRVKAGRLVLAGAALAVTLGGTALVLDQMAAGQPGQGVASTVPDQAATQAVTAPSATAAGPGAVASPGAAAGPGAAGADGAGSPAGVREVLPPVSESPPGLPEPSPQAALIRGPLPPTAASQGKIVDGFPADILAFPTGTVVVSTGVSSADRILQVTADALVSSSQDSVVGHFQQIMLPLGFWSEPAPAPEGQRVMRFIRGGDALTLTTSTTGTGSTRFMLLGNLHAAGDG